MRYLLVGSLCIASLLAPGRARACGGLVAPANTSIGQDAQRAVLSVHPSTTDVVLQIFVPQAGNYGVLVPAPAEPTLDANPVDANVLNGLDSATQPNITKARSSSSKLPSLGCGSKAADIGSVGGGGVRAGPQVTIGPVVAVKLQADTGTALTQWLSDNGFALPASAQPTIDAYAGSGRWFIAFKAKEPQSAQSSVGVHFSVPGDHREYALRMTRIGGADQLALTVFVAATVDAAPAAPFAALTLADLDKDLLQSNTYREAVAQAVDKHQGKAWVVEGRYTEAILPPVLQALAEPKVIVTRISTVVKASTLDQDVVFNAPAPDTTTNSRDLNQGSLSDRDTPRGGGGSPGAGVLALAALLVLRVSRRPLPA